MQAPQSLLFQTMLGKMVLIEVKQLAHLEAHCLSNTGKNPAKNMGNYKGNTITQENQAI